MTLWRTSVFWRTRRRRRAFRVHAITSLPSFSSERRGGVSLNWSVSLILRPPPPLRAAPILRPPTLLTRSPPRGEVTSGEFGRISPTFSFEAIVPPATVQGFPSSLLPLLLLNILSVVCVSSPLFSFPNFPPSPLLLSSSFPLLLAFHPSSSSSSPPPP